MTQEQAVPLTEAGKALSLRRAMQNGVDLMNDAAMAVINSDILAIEAEAYKAGRDDPERAAVAGKTAQAVDREGGATTPAHAQDPDSAEHVHPGGFTGRHQHGGWHRHEVSDREAYKAGRDGLRARFIANLATPCCGGSEPHSEDEAVRSRENAIAAFDRLATPSDNPKEPTE